MELFVCNICGNIDNNKTYEGREMMFGMRETFTYIKCAKCGCLQIKTIPDNMEKYYPENYYSFNHVQKRNLKNKISFYLMKHALNFRLGKLDPIGLFATTYNKYYKLEHPWLNKKYCSLNSKILDIGCGNGFRLDEMKQFGFSNLTGLDPYIKETTTTPFDVKIIKDELFNIKEQFDLIMLHHSFEHMANPKEIFNSLFNIISDKGFVLIRIPVADCYAWRKYGMNWFQVDAPRHFFLHTTKSIAILAKEANLEIENIIFDSTHSQCYMSEKYLQDIPLLDTPNKNLDSFVPHFKKLTKNLNNYMDGDQACFLLKKKV